MEMSVLLSLSFARWVRISSSSSLKGSKGADEIPTTLSFYGGGG